jgi:alanine-glyoxylate transaminase/serine-glyoxylate transaminase/serine-pyruvate transaminase
VLEALSQPTIGHLDPAFLSLMDEVRDGLRELFATRNAMTLAMSGTGSAGMETVIVNLVEPGDRVLVGVNGVFGARLAEVARRAGAHVEVVPAAYGEPLDRDQLATAIATHAPHVVALVHAETSTGIENPIAGLADVVHAHDGLLVLDCVTSLAGMPVEIDAWGVDAAYAATQKCMSCPPGLSPVTLSERAVAKLERRSTKVASWYLDLSLLRSYWGSERAYHHTAPINMLYALHESLAMVREEGLPQRYLRHRAAHEHLVTELAALGLGLLGREGRRIPMLNVIGVPAIAGDESVVRKRLLMEHGIEIGGGLGEFKGRAWRVGLMGHGATTSNVDALIVGLRACGVTVR